MGSTIGFIGLGNMGEPMATRLLEAGNALVVYDTRKEALDAFKARSASVASSPQDVANQAETVFISLPTPPIVEAVVLGVGGIASGSKVKTVVDLSTTGPKAAAQIGTELEKKGITLVDAPVSGGVGGARAGTLAVMVSAPQATFEALGPHLKTIGKVFHIGEKPGLGQTMKLVNNLLSGAAMALSAEAVTMGVKAGIDADVMIDVINAGSGRNTATMDKFPKCILPGTFDYGFATKLMYKDIKLFMEEAEEMGLSLRTSAAVRQLWQEVLQEIGDKDFTTIVQLTEQRAGVKVRGKAAKGGA